MRSQNFLALLTYVIAPQVTVDRAAKLEPSVKAYLYKPEVYQGIYRKCGNGD